LEEGRQNLAEFSDIKTMGGEGKKPRKKNDRRLHGFDLGTLKEPRTTSK